MVIKVEIENFTENELKCKCGCGSFNVDKSIEDILYIINSQNK